MKIELRDYQKEAVKFALKVPHSLFCMRVGCGKTVCAMFSVRAMLKRNLINKVVIACTKTATSVFVEDFKEKAGIDVPTIEKEDDFIDFLKNNSKICIIKHSMFDKMGNDFIYLKRFESIVNKQGLKIGLVIDEAHKLQNPEGITHEAYLRTFPLYERVMLYTATPYSSCLSQFYGLVDLIHQEVWKSMRTFCRLYIDEVNIIDPKTHRVVRKEKVRYKNLKEFRACIEPFTYFYYPPIPLVHIEHHTRLSDYTEYDKLCQGLLTDEDLQKIKDERAQ